jgi:predicted PurR-regulated permease PerM
MWGIVGMIISVPLMAVLKVFLEHIPATQPIAVMLGNKAP